MPLFPPVIRTFQPVMSACIQSFSFMWWLYRMNSICRHCNRWNVIYKENDYHFGSSCLNGFYRSFRFWRRFSGFHETYRKQGFPRFRLKQASTERNITCSVDGIRFQHNWHMEKFPWKRAKTGLSLESIIIICEPSDTPVIWPDLHDCASRAIIVIVHAEYMETWNHMNGRKPEFDRMVSCDIIETVPHGNMMMAMITMIIEWYSITDTMRTTNLTGSGSCDIIEHVDETQAISSAG